jgi:hypothetical protein
MKAVLATLGVLAIVLTAAPAAAQMKGGKMGHDDKKAEPKKKVDDKGYKDALERLPDQKFDPWGKVR